MARELEQPEAEKTWGAPHQCYLLPVSLHLHPGSFCSASFHLPIIPWCSLILTMLLCPQVFPCLGHLPDQLPLSLNIIRVDCSPIILKYNRKFPEQVRETETHSPLLPPVTSPSSAHGICREALGLSRYLLSMVCILGGSTKHSPVTHSSCKEVKTQGLFPLNSTVPLLSTWMIRSDFSKALYLAKFREIFSKVAESTPVTHRPLFFCISRSDCTTWWEGSIPRKHFHFQICRNSHPTPPPNLILKNRTELAKIFRRKLV